MSTIIHLHKQHIALDDEGFLLDMDDWTEPLAEVLAQREGIDYGKEHLEVVRLLRQFYGQYQLSPAMRPLVKYIGQHLGPERGNSLYLMRLFPGSPAKLASKIAGLPKPDNCL